LHQQPEGEAISLSQISTNQPTLFGDEPDGLAPSPAGVKSARSKKRAACREQDLARTTTYLMGQARTEDERAFVERFYEDALEEGPDFTNYRAKSSFQATPKLVIYAHPLEKVKLATTDLCRAKTNRCAVFSHFALRKG
jgi:hypothetical protein